MRFLPLTNARWAVDGQSEHGTVPLSHIYQIERTRNAIGVIARMVGNSAGEPAASNASPLDAWTISSLLGGIESLCDHIGVLTDEMLERATMPNDPGTP
jgi:hypothetical protein